MEIREDISNEKIRSYYYPSGYVEIVFEPRTLSVDDLGQHIIEDSRGRTTLVRSGWIKLEKG